MSRSVGGAIGILLTAAALTNAQEGGPPLDAPKLAPPVEASSPAPARTGVETPTRRPFLVIPGVTAPAAVARSAHGPTSLPDPTPPLAGPASAPSGGGTPMVTTPPTLEPIPDHAEVDHRPDDEPAGPKPAGRPAGPPATPLSAAVEERAGARHVPGAMLGRLLGFDAGRDDVRGAITIESKADPAVDAAVKRRIEKAVKESLGDRASDVEVRVQGRNVLIRARASRFWHRRSVRRALDSFQFPAGYHGRAELME